MDPACVTALFCCDPPDGSSAGLMVFRVAPLESRGLLLLRCGEFIKHSNPSTGLGRSPGTPVGAELHVLTHWECRTHRVPPVSKETAVGEGTSPLLGSSRVPVTQQLLLGEEGRAGGT